MNRLIIAGLVALWGSAVAIVLTGLIWDVWWLVLAVFCFIAGLITAPLFLKVQNYLPWTAFAALASTFLGAGFFGFMAGISQGFGEAVDGFLEFPLLLGLYLPQELPALLTWAAGAVVIHFVGRYLVNRRLP